MNEYQAIIETYDDGGELHEVTIYVESESSAEARRKIRKHFGTTLVGIPSIEPSEGSDSDTMLV